MRMFLLHNKYSQKNSPSLISWCWNQTIMVLSKSKGAKQNVKGIMCLGSEVEFLISAGSGEQRQDWVEARRGSAALIWVTGLWGTVITLLSSSGLKWCSWAWRAGTNEPVHSHTDTPSEVSYIWNTCTLSLVWVCGSIINTSKSRLFLFTATKWVFVQLQFKNTFVVKYCAHGEML